MLLEVKVLLKCDLRSLLSHVQGDGLPGSALSAPMAFSARALCLLLTVSMLFFLLEAESCYAALAFMIPLPKPES